MRIGIDGLPLTASLAGIGHYTLELARYLSRGWPEDEIDIISPKPFHPSVLNHQKDSQPHLVRKRVNPITGRWWSFGLPRYLKHSPPDVFHGTNFEIPFRSVCPTVITIHDLSLLLYPETHQRRRVWRARRRLPSMARRATMIITVSEAVRAEINQHLKMPLEKIVVVPSAARKIFSPMDPQKAAQIRRRLNVRDNFLLYVGTIEPRKNLRLLVQAFEESSLGKDQGVQLVLAGKKGWLVDELYQSLNRSATSRNVEFTGYLNDEELSALYSSCKLFVYPSLYEGFGLPPLEAMACGAPVLASRIPSISEVVSTAAHLVSPHSSRQLADAMREITTNDALRQKMTVNGFSRVAEFSWEKTAELTRGVYEEAIDRFKRQNSTSNKRKKASSVKS
jgi:glycosyltransferase involved in cell wall biosynthesis